MTSIQPHSLAGLVRCGAAADSCDAPLTVSRSGDARDYTCPNGHLRVDAAALDETIAVRALARLAAPAIRARLEDVGHDMDVSPAGLATWWVDAGPTQRRSMLDRLIGRVTVHTDRPKVAGGLTLTWR